MLRPLSSRITKLSSSEQFDFVGDFSTWEEARNASTGYDAIAIVENTKTALLKVKNGEAIYERDSVLFDTIQYAWPLLAGLMWVAAQTKGKLNVLDFGGSLGTTYYQNRYFLMHLPEVRWNVIEQPLHVQIGREWFEDKHLKFYTSIEQCVAETLPTVGILSSVLQYLEHPYAILQQLFALPSITSLIIDRTPFGEGRTDRLCVQAVPQTIYPASYPIWIFSRQIFHSQIPEEWTTLVKFDSLDRLKGQITAAYQGEILVRRTNLS